MGRPTGVPRSVCPTKVPRPGPNATTPVGNRSGLPGLSERPGDDEFVIPAERTHDGSDGEWSANGFAKWARRVLTPAADAVGRPDLTPYVLRHSFASLLAHEGRSAVYIAAQLGHGPDLSIRIYQHVISEFEDAPRLSAEDAIRQAREQRLRKLG